MCVTKRLTLVLMCFAALILCGVVLGCGPAAMEEALTEPVRAEGTATEKATSRPELPRPTFEPLPQPELQPGDPFLAEYRFIVTGPNNQVDSAVSTATKRMKIEVMRTHSLGLDLLEGLDDCPGLPRFQGADPVMVHYLILSEPGNQPSSPPAAEISLAVQVVRQINELTKEGVVSSVFADLVWGTTNVGDRRWHGGESPAKDFYIPFQGDPADGQAAFCGQWAFVSDEGIRLSTCEDRSEDSFTGEGVRIGVFDTVPADVPEALPLIVEREQMEKVRDLEVDWQFPDTTKWRMPQFKDHGLFVAGLVNAVAPDSTIVLYPVLYGNGLGDLFTLDYALHSFISDTLRERGALKGAVINLSLGSPMDLPYIPPDSSLAAPFEQEVAPWPLLESATSLRTLLSAAVCHDIVVVAAAGNEGSESDLPAAYPWVIGVMASTVEGEKACYSNTGQIAAPGGGTLNAEYCVPKMEALYNGCWNADSDEQSEACGSFLMSLVTDPEKSPPVVHAYGTGTSFSAPLVSGLAALIQSAGAQVAGGWVPPDVVKASIASTTHHDGVIDMPSAVQRSLETLNPQ